MLSHVVMRAKDVQRYKAFERETGISGGLRVVKLCLDFCALSTENINSLE